MFLLWVMILCRHWIRLMLIHVPDQEEVIWTIRAYWACFSVPFCQILIRTIQIRRIFNFRKGMWWWLFKTFFSEVNAGNLFHCRRRAYFDFKSSSRKFLSTLKVVTIKWMHFKLYILQWERIWKYDIVYVRWNYFLIENEMNPFCSKCFIKRTANFRTKEYVLKVVFSLQRLQGLNDKVFTFFQVNAVIFCAYSFLKISAHNSTMRSKNCIHNGLKYEKNAKYSLKEEITVCTDVR